MIEEEGNSIIAKLRIWHGSGEKEKKIKLKLAAELIDTNQWYLEDYYKGVAL